MTATTTNGAVTRTRATNQAVRDAHKNKTAVQEIGGILEMSGLHTYAATTQVELGQNAEALHAAGAILYRGIRTSPNLDAQQKRTAARKVRKLLQAAGDAQAASARMIMAAEKVVLSAMPNDVNERVKGSSFNAKA